MSLICTQNNNKKNILIKPTWMKVRLPSNFNKINQIKTILRNSGLNSVCEEAQCPNLYECFNHGTVTFMILGNKCTRKCTFCAVQHGRPLPPNINEPKNLAQIVFNLNIKHVVITSVVRDDLHDGGAQHFIDCIQSIRNKTLIKIEILVPDFRRCVDLAVNLLSKYPPNIFNHNLENVPRLYKIIRPGANYKNSLKLLEKFKIKNPNISTKSGLMLGLGETKKEILVVMKDLRNVGVSMLTLGQYLQPSSNHFPVQRYVTPSEFQFFEKEALKLGFKTAYCGPFVRSSYHADIQV